MDVLAWVLIVGRNIHYIALLLDVAPGRVLPNGQHVVSGLQR